MARNGRECYINWQKKYFHALLPYFFLCLFCTLLSFIYIILNIHNKFHRQRRWLSYAIFTLSPMYIEHCCSSTHTYTQTELMWKSNFSFNARRSTHRFVSAHQQRFDQFQDSLSPFSPAAPMKWRTKLYQLNFEMKIHFIHVVDAVVVAFFFFYYYYYTKYKFIWNKSSE